MPTYTQLQAESWWNREIKPAALVALGERLCKAFNRPLAAYGIKGDNAHLGGAHRSQEWILNSRYCTNRTYTVQSGLTATQTQYIAGLDFNPGSTERMILICRRLDEAVRAGRLEQVREWYGNDDGDNRVDGYDNVRNRVATSDSSHLWHVHLTLDRRKVNDEAAMRAVGDVLLGAEEDHVTAKENWEHPILNPESGNEASAQWRLLDTERKTARVHDTALPALARIEATLAVMAGKDPVAAVREEFDQLEAALRANLAEQLGTVIREEITEASDEQVERVFRRVLGSVDES